MILQSQSTSFSIADDHQIRFLFSPTFPLTPLKNLIQPATRTFLSQVYLAQLIFAQTDSRHQFHCLLRKKQLCLFISKSSFKSI